MKGKVEAPCKRNGVLCENHALRCRESCTKWKVYEILKKAEEKRRKNEWFLESMMKDYIYKSMERTRKFNDQHKR